MLVILGKPRCMLSSRGSPSDQRQLGLQAVRKASSSPFSAALPPHSSCSAFQARLAQLAGATSARILVDVKWLANVLLSSVVYSA